MFFLVRRIRSFGGCKRQEDKQYGTVGAGCCIRAEEVWSSYGGILWYFFYKRLAKKILKRIEYMTFKLQKSSM